MAFKITSKHLQPGDNFGKVVREVHVRADGFPLSILRIEVLSDTESVGRGVIAMSRGREAEAHVDLSESVIVDEDIRNRVHWDRCLDEEMVRNDPKDLCVSERVHLSDFGTNIPSPSL